MANFIIGMEIHVLPKDHEAKYKWCKGFKVDKDGKITDGIMTNVFKESFIMNEHEAKLFVRLSDKLNDEKETWDLMTLIIKHVESDQTLTYKEFKGLYDV